MYIVFIKDNTPTNRRRAIEITPLMRLVSEKEFQLKLSHGSRIAPLSNSKSSRKKSKNFELIILNLVER